MYDIIERYNQILIRDLGFKDLDFWSPMIEKITKTLDILEDEILKDFRLGSSLSNPGYEICNHLINSWIDNNGWRYGKIFEIEKNVESTPYNYYITYTIKVMKEENIILDLSSVTIWRDYEKIKSFLESDNYKKIFSLNGFQIR